MDLRSNAREPIRTFPLKTRSGKLKSEALRRKSSINLSAPVSIMEKDVESWLARLKASGVQETSVLAQERRAPVSTCSAATPLTLILCWTGDP